VTPDDLRTVAEGIVEKWEAPIPMQSRCLHGVDGLITAITDALRGEREACAAIAWAHRGAAESARRQRGMKLSQFHVETRSEIQAEERGETIAAEAIAAAIHARTGGSDAKE
jgi:hypothetical protein